MDTVKRVNDKEKEDPKSNSQKNLPDIEDSVGG